MENEKQAEEALRSALASIETGNDVQEDFGGGADSSWTIGMGGHGIHNRAICFAWHDARLSIDYKLPWARVFASEASRAEDANLVRAALRLAILLLEAYKAGTLFADGEELLDVTADGDGVAYGFKGPDGSVLDEADDWGALVARLEASAGSATPESVDIIWP